MLRMKSSVAEVKNVKPENEKKPLPFVKKPSPSVEEPPAEEETSTHEASPADPVEDKAEDTVEVESGNLDPVTVHYMDSSCGPFECQRCVHWLEPDGCDKVSGDIDPKGMCNLFSCDASKEQVSSPDMEE